MTSKFGICFDSFFLAVRRSAVQRMAASVALATVASFIPLAQGQCSWETLAGGDFFGIVRSFASGVSADGQTVVGRFQTPHPSGQYQIDHPFVWTAEHGMVDPCPVGGGAAIAVSGDGSIFAGVVASDGVGGWSRWTTDGVFDFLDGGAVKAISGDGTVLVGRARVMVGQSYEEGAVRWTFPKGILQSLEPEPTGDAFGVSHDGSVIVGWVRCLDGSCAQNPFRWTEGTGVVRLGTLSQPTTDSGIATAVSADGATVVGWSASPRASTVNGYTASEAFRWTEASGMVGLGFLPNSPINYSRAISVSGDGSIIVGVALGRADEGLTVFIWDEVHGMRRLKDVLTDDCGLDLRNWFFRGYHDRPVSISADGTTVVGFVIGRDYLERAFIARVPRGIVDCNHNGHADKSDLSSGRSLDCNGNGLPDDCELAHCPDDPACGDCNINGILDGCEITADPATDSDSDGLLDECEGCCNGCDDGDICTIDQCVGGTCLYTPSVYGDVGPCGGDGLIDITDVITILNAYVDQSVCGCIPRP